MKYTFDELRAMSDEELRQISLERNKKGFTENANKAYQVRKERKNQGNVCERIGNKTSFTRTLISEKGTSFDGF